MAFTQSMQAELLARRDLVEVASVELERFVFNTLSVDEVVTALKAAEDELLKLCFKHYGILPEDLRSVQLNLQSDSAKLVAYRTATEADAKRKEQEYRLMIEKRKATALLWLQGLQDQSRLGK